MADDAEVITTYLEMREPQVLQVTPLQRPGMLLRVSEASAEFYRYLLSQGFPDVVPGDDRSCAALLSDEAYDIYVLFLGGVPAAMFELDRRNPEAVELVRFGVLEGFGGRGLAKYVLAAAVETAWQHGPLRVWVRASNRDDPRRILTLQWAGFVPYETTRERSG
jgi:GNAT superfamily N-acetyltransferase